MSSPETPRPDSEVRVLRLGLLRDGQVVAERLAQPGEVVTLGRSRRNTLVIDDPALPGRQIVFSPERGGTVLVLRPGMSGRVALPGGVHELQSASSEQRVVLDDRSRGRVQIGSWTLLFQWVTAPPVPLRAAPSFRPSLLGGDDPVFASSLGTYAALAVGFFAFLSQVQLPAEAADFDAMPQRYADILREATIPAPPPVVGEVEETSAAERRQERRERRQDEREARREERADNRAERRERSEQEQLAEVQARVFEILGTHGESGRSDLFSASDEVGAAVNARLGQIEGADTAGLSPVGLRSGQGGRSDAGPQVLGRSGSGTTSVDGGPAAATVRTRVGVIEATGARGTQAEGVKKAIDRYSSAIQNCYEQALRASPDLSGRLVLSLSVTAGEVREAEVVENGTHDDGLASCAELRARSWHFDRDVTIDLLAPFSLSR